MWKLEHFFNFYILGLTMISCSPFEEKSVPVHEIQVTDPDFQHAAMIPSTYHIEGNIFMEVQEDAQASERRVYAQASFFEPQSKNILFSDVRVSLVEMGLYNGELSESHPEDPEPPGSDDDSSPGDGPPGDFPNE